MRHGLVAIAAEVVFPSPLLNLPVSPCQLLVVHLVHVPWFHASSAHTFRTGHDVTTHKPSTSRSLCRVCNWLSPGRHLFIPMSLVRPVSIMTLRSHCSLVLPPVFPLKLRNCHGSICPRGRNCAEIVPCRVSSPCLLASCTTHSLDPVVLKSTLPPWNQGSQTLAARV